MAARRLSKLPRQILNRMWTQYERPQGGISTDHLELVKHSDAIKAMSVTVGAPWRPEG
jgi:hypothetical protein